MWRPNSFLLSQFKSVPIGFYEDMAVDAPSILLLENFSAVSLDLGLYVTTNTLRDIVKRDMRLSHDIQTG